MDSTQHLLSEEALVTDWETLSANITNAIEEVQALTAASKAITFNIEGGELLDYIRNLKASEKAMQETAGAMQNLTGTVKEYNGAIESAIITEQSHAIVNLNNINKRKAAEADLLQSQIAYGDKYTDLLNAEAAAQEKRDVKDATAKANQKARAADLLRSQQAFGDAYLAMLDKQAAAESATQQKLITSYDKLTSTLAGQKSIMLEMVANGLTANPMYLQLAESANILATAQERVNNAIANPAGLAQHLQNQQNAPVVIASEDVQTAKTYNEQLDEIRIKNESLVDSQISAATSTKEDTIIRKEQGIVIDQTSVKIRNLEEQLIALQYLLNNSTKGSAGFNDLNIKIEKTNTELAALKGMGAQSISTLNKEVSAVVPQVEKADSAFKLFGINLDSLLARMTIRMIAFQLLFAPIVSGIQMIGTSILEMIPGTDAFITAQEKVISTNKDLKASFDGLTEAIKKTADEQKKYDAISLADAETRENILENTIDGLKRTEAATKAAGITSGAVYDAEMSQMKAANDVREKELKQLNDKLAITRQIELFLTNAQGHNNEQIQDQLTKSGLPEDAIKSLSASLNKANKDGGNFQVGKVLDQLQRQYGGESVDTQQAIKTKSQDITDAVTALAAKVSEIQYNKDLELKKQLAQTAEQYRQANEKEDAASIDKIVGDVKAKYSLLEKDVSQNRENYRLSVTSKDNVGYTDKNIEAYDRLLALLKQIGDQDKLNQEYELSNSQYSNNSNVGAGLSKGNADSSSFNSGFGVPDYAKGASAIDAETVAKKDALQNQFRQLASTITDSNQIIEAQKQLDEKLLEVDKNAYRERLALANDFFNKSAAKITEASADLTTENSRRHLDNLTSIINGNGSSATKDLKTLIEEQQNIKANSNIGLQDVNQKLPGAQAAYGKAESVAQGPLSADYQAEADKQKDEAKKTYDDLLTLKSQYNNDIANADKTLADKEKEYADAIKNALINAFKESAAAIKQIQDNQIAAQQQQLEIKQQQIDLQSKQEIAAIDATTGYAITKDNEKAVVTAQTTAAQNQLQQQSNALTLKKAKGDKQYAEMQVVMNTATAIMKAFADFPYPVAIPIAAILAATGALEYSAAASTPLPQFYMGGTTTTNAFSAGERGFELITPPNKPAYFSTNTASVYNEPIGTQITAHDQTKAIIQQAAYNVYAKEAGHVKEGNFAKEVAKELSMLIGDKFEDVGNGIQTAVYRSRAIVNINARNGGDRLTYKLGRNK